MTDTDPTEHVSTARKFYRNQVDIDWPTWWRRGLTASAVIIVICLGSLVFRGLNLGLEFEGGAVWEAEANGADAGEVRSTMADIGFAGATIQISGDVVQVRAEVDTADEATSQQVAEALAEVTGTSVNDVVINDISASWGDELTTQALRALVVFLIAIAIYLTLRFHWRMAVAALVALAHDIVLTVGIYSVFQFEVTSATVIAFLTILGYSLYDTLVVFDRVRENEGRPALNGKVAFADIMSLSANQVFMRSVNTTLTSVLPIISVLVVGSIGLGAVTLREFAIALLVGLLSGTYSSLFVAAPVLVALKNREPRYAALVDLAGSTGRDELASMAATAPTAKRTRPDERRISAGTAKRQTPAASGTIPPRPRKQKRRG
jgi:preprotein translocase subunit SecF